MENQEQNLNTNNSLSNQQRKYIYIALTILLAIGIFRIGYSFGQRGYVFSASDFKVTSQTNSSPANYSLLWQALDIVKSKYIDRNNIDQQKVLYGAIRGAVSAAGDEYTEFFDPKTLSEFRTELQGSFSGIGAEIGKRNGNIVIIAPIDDTPASKAGLQAQDVIVSIDGTSTAEMSTDEAVGKIRGQSGTSVKLTIYREGKTGTFDVTIVRQKIEIKSVKLNYKEQSGKKVAVITISRFGDDTEELFENAVKDIQAQKPSAIILDLRNDPGGYLNVAVDIASDWLEKDQLVVKEERSDKDVNNFTSTGINRLGGYKTFVLLNKGSASASEILAGALRDHQKAVIIGEKSFGKGSVQELVPLGKDMAVKVTVAKWITPSGQHLNKDGIDPNIKVELKEDDVNNKRDPQMDRALQESVK